MSKNQFQFRLKIPEGTQYRLTLFGVAIWVSSHFNTQGWARLFGRGLKWKHESLGLMFSQRAGLTKYVKIGKWVVSYLPRY